MYLHTDLQLVLKTLGQSLESLEFALEQFVLLLETDSLLDLLSCLLLQ